MPELQSSHLICPVTGAAAAWELDSNAAHTRAFVLCCTGIPSIFVTCQFSLPNGLSSNSSCGTPGHALLSCVAVHSLYARWPCCRKQRHQTSIVLSALQDDLATIGRFLPRAPAQFGSSVSTASPLTATSSSSPSETATATASGVLSSSNQTDFFSFAAAAGPASITVAVTAPFGVGYYGRSNLNAVSTVFDATGAVLATFNPPGPENMGIAAANVTIPSSGVYYVSVAGSGEGNVSIDGYSSYASLGRYSVSVTYASGFTPPAVDCMGAWSSWSVCNASCNQTMTFRITRPAANGGGACVSADGSVRSQPCSGGACLAAIDDPIVIIADITISRETFNMSTNSTNGTAPANGTNNTTVRANPSGSAPPQYAFCKAVVTLKTKAGARLAKAKISGSWSDIDVARSKPTVAAPTSLQTRPSGQVVFKSRPWRADLQPPQQPAQNGAISACVFTVSGVDFPGKTLDRAASVLTQKLTFDGR